MELKEDMYHVRSEDGKLWLCKCEGLTPEQYIETHKDIYKITKVSYNPIELIEVGDYVNGERIIEISTTGEVLFYQDYDVVKSIENNSIKSIVTKEQFEQIQYRIGD